MSAGGIAASLSLFVWVGLILLRGGFWRANQRISSRVDHPSKWPEVAAVIPARDEAGGVAQTVRSLLQQSYPGRFSIVLVDDGSTDGTADIARAAAEGSSRLTVVPGRDLPPGWTGKLWAVQRGVEEASRIAPEAEYLLLTDADIEHAPSNLRELVAKADAKRLSLVSLMVRLRCVSPWERLLIPAFVFFFQKLYPFPWVNHPRHRTAAAAGGCMLVRRSSLARAGGIEAIRGALIDDCALAREIKKVGPIWLGLSADTRSLRRYDTLWDIWGMVARTAFEQLGNSSVMLAVTVVAMVITYLIPPAAMVYGAMEGDATTAVAGLAAWLAMVFAYRPTLVLYGQPAWAAFGLPIAALIYTAMTVDSARRHWRGRGGAWKGRYHHHRDTNPGTR